MATIAKPVSVSYPKKEATFATIRPYLVIGLVILTVFLIIYLILGVKIIYAEYKITNLKKVASVKEEEYKKLSFKYEGLLSKERITNIAINELNMVTPTEVEWVIVERREKSNKRVK